MKPRVSVEARANFHDLGDNFNHLVAHALSCTNENDDVCAKKYGSICFEPLSEVMKNDDLEWLDEGKGVPKKVRSTGRA